jgi:hypothetical protein
VYGGQAVHTPHFVTCGAHVEYVEYVEYGRPIRTPHVPGNDNPGPRSVSGPRSVLMLNQCRMAARPFGPIGVADVYGVVPVADGPGGSAAPAGRIRDDAPGWSVTAHLRRLVPLRRTDLGDAEEEQKIWRAVLAECPGDREALAGLERSANAMAMTPAR